jgi:hypothetical protein
VNRIIDKYRHYFILTLMPALACTALAAPAAPTERPPLLIHVMPWFSADAESLGWHWRMNRSAEEVCKSGRIASHFRPLIGPYDSLDPDLIELQVGWMKLAGFDGVLADWYGTQSHFDYPMIHQRTKALFDVATKAGLTIGVVYEDQTVGNAIREKLITADQAAPIARQTGKFLAKEWFTRPNWLRIKGKPAVLVFGPQYFTQDYWAAFGAAAGDYQLLTLHKTHPFSQGGYDWPIPSLGMKFTDEFGARSKGWSIRIPVAFPRFKDFYAAAGEKSYPELPDRDGQTYCDTLAAAIALAPDAVQVATWNDWQEGTQIEPSIELGLRDLIATQEARRKLDPRFPFTSKDLDLPLAIFQARKKMANPAQLQPLAEALLQGKTDYVRRQLPLLKDEK